MKTWPQGDSNIFLTNIPNFPKIPRDIKWLRELPSPPHWESRLIVYLHVIQAKIHYVAFPVICS